ncbi:uncharacterized protein LOC133188208 [Saccostrea echinata]|uniref:uncharacterized protein LOC133188208 n=1 Tax=Saccostrea echinata TaxID=191078 RepID=UPI002A81E25A|nr:uncharacterized protein LOC133188208 [Saccostrea echinata]
MTYYHKKRNMNESEENDTDVEEEQTSSSFAFGSPKVIKLEVPRSMSSHAKCQFCTQREDLVVINEDTRTKFFIETGTILPEGTRCCQKHFSEGGLKEECKKMLSKVTDHIMFNRTDLMTLLHNVRMNVLNKPKGIDFDNPLGLSDTDYIHLTGLTKQQFDNLVTYLPSLRNTSVRSARTCLGLLLTKLRTGVSLKVMSSMFQIPNVQYISKAIHSARAVLMKEFVPQHLGTQHISRDEFIREHTTAFVKQLFADGQDVTALVIDGTYIYIEKSSNYSFQRRTYSAYKSRPLLKPMMIVGTDGYILDAIGPYLADGRNNDASILTSIMKNDTERLKTWLSDGDIFVLDRGFRDCRDFLQQMGFRTQMPCYLEKGKKQHSTEEANESRMVTKYRPPIRNSEFEDTELAIRMSFLSKTTNELQKRVENEKLAAKRSVWESVDGFDMEDFPRLSEDALRNITVGVYQLKQAKAYTIEHISPEGKYELFVHKQDDGLLKAKLQSRHSSSKTYILWISYDSEKRNPITGWYCQCKSGARTLGCCAHIAAVLWYLSFQRHQDGKLVPRPFFDYTKDAADCDWLSGVGSE